MARLRVTAVSTEMGDNEANIDAEIEGADQEIAFDVRYLLAMLDAITANQLTLELTQSTRPGLFHTVDVPKENHFAVVMPMHPQK